MMPIFAQLENVAPQAIRDFALIVAGASVTAYYIKELFWGGGSRSISPQPFLVAMEKEFTARRDFDTHVNLNKTDHDQMEYRINEVEKGISTTTEKKIEVVRKDLFEVGKYVSSLQTSTELQNQQLARIESKLDRLKD
jgi:hypothetical protein